MWHSAERPLDESHGCVAVKVRERAGLQVGIGANFRVERIERALNVCDEALPVKQEPPISLLKMKPCPLRAVGEAQSVRRREVVKSRRHRKSL